MTAPTHIAIALSFGVLAGVGKPQLALMAAGAILPDIDHPQSTVGRCFFPISIPLSEWLGHRGPVHSFWLWGAVTLFGMIWWPLYFIGIGGILHVLADCGTVSGVQALAPWSQKLFVIFRRDWRIKTGTPSEIVIMLVFGAVAWSGGYVGSMGGIAAMLGHLTGAPKIMMEEYPAKGLSKCFVEGKIRWKNGEITTGRWLIIGKEGPRGLALLAENQQLIHIPDSGDFLKARLEVTEEKWKSARLTGWARTGFQAYFWDGERWNVAEKGGVVWGQIISEAILLENI